MRTFKRIVIEDFSLTAENGDHFEIKRGEECITSSEDRDGMVTVFSNFWVPVPITHFAGSRLFTEGETPAPSANWSA